MITYGSNQCWLCLCEVCTRIRCPKLNRRYKLDFCISMLTRERCPVKKCEWFEHKQKHRVYKVLRRERKRERIMERLDDIQKVLEALQKAHTD